MSRTPSNAVEGFIVNDPTADGNHVSKKAAVVAVLEVSTLKRRLTIAVGSTAGSLLAREVANSSLIVWKNYISIS